MSPVDCEQILGFPVTTYDIVACVRRICSWIRANDASRYMVCANPHSLEMACTDLIFADAIHHADLVTPDGVGMLVASRILGGSIRRRITGSDIFSSVSLELNRTGRGRYFFLGSTEATLERLRNKFQHEFPEIEIAGSYSPPFKPVFSPEDNRIMVDRIHAAAPNVLWVGMTAPKQEKWIFQNREKLNVAFIGAVGAVFDFYTENVKRSPEWFLNHGLEWLPRLLYDPRRLWDRTVLSAPSFLIRVFRQRLNQ